MKAETQRQHFASFQLSVNVYIAKPKFFWCLLVSKNDHESAMRIDFDVTNKF